MRIAETLREAFVKRLFGFTFFALIPALVFAMASWETLGYNSLFWVFGNIAVWLLVIRLNLPKEDTHESKSAL